MLFYFAIVFTLMGMIAAIAGIAYAADTSDKDIPVAVKFMLTGVFSGWPPSNATDVWREQFKQPNVAVWPYYCLLGALCASIIILVTFACLGCTFDENERDRRPCNQHCGQDCAFCDSTCRTDIIYCPGSGGGDCDCKGHGAKDCGELLLMLVLLLIVIILVSALATVIGYAASKGALFHDRMTEMMEYQAQELESETIVLGVDETLRPTDAV
jgi:hypothetical protein